MRQQEYTQVVGTLTDLNHHSTAGDFITTVEWGAYPLHIAYRCSMVRSSIASLVFEPNWGQTDEQVEFVSCGVNYAVYFTPQGAVLSLVGDSSSAINGNSDASRIGEGDMPGVTPAMTTGMYMRWLGGNLAPPISGLEPQPGVSNYFTGLDSNNWITDVPQYGRIRYESVYEHIDLEYYSREGQLEFYWIVRPGGDPRDIVMDFAGADSLSIDSAGAIATKRWPVAHFLSALHGLTVNFTEQSECRVDEQLA